jgi:hypothetical protein
VKLALHRSITFWSGILVMGFICWAWRDSHPFESVARRGPALISNTKGFLCVGHLVGITGDDFHRSKAATEYAFELLPLPFSVWGGSVRGGTPAPAPEDRSTETFRAAAIRSWSNVTPYRVVCIPHWFLLLAVAIPWFALLLWRARRRKPAYRRLKLAP